MVWKNFESELAKWMKTFTKPGLTFSGGRQLPEPHGHPAQRRTEVGRRQAEGYSRAIVVIGAGIRTARFSHNFQ